VISRLPEPICRCVVVQLQLVYMVKRRPTYEPPVTIRFGRELMARLGAEWKRTGLPIAEQVRQAVAQWLDAREKGR
jgi:hypothetical protein